MMERARRVLKWKQRPEWFKTTLLLVMVAGATFGGYGVFMLAMGTTSPLVVVTSESMEPILYRGDLLVVQARAPDQIRLGDIIVYRDTEFHPETSIVHRVVEIVNVNGTYFYYTKGDANPVRDDGYRTYDEVVGAMVLTIPWIGNVSLFLRTPQGFILVAAIFIAILVLPEIACKKDEQQAKTAEA